MGKIFKFGQILLNQGKEVQIIVQLKITDKKNSTGKTSDLLMLALLGRPLSRRLCL